MDDILHENLRRSSRLLIRTKSIVGLSCLPYLWKLTFTFYVCTIFDSFSPFPETEILWHSGTSRLVHTKISGCRGYAKTNCRSSDSDTSFRPSSRSCNTSHTILSDAGISVVLGGKVISESCHFHLDEKENIHGFMNQVRICAEYGRDRIFLF